jgi:hypothetical protein
MQPIAHPEASAQLYSILEKAQQGLLGHHKIVKLAGGQIDIQDTKPGLVARAAECFLKAVGLHTVYLRYKVADLYGHFQKLTSTPSPMASISWLTAKAFSSTLEKAIDHNPTSVSNIHFSNESLSARLVHGKQSAEGIPLFIDQCIRFLEREDQTIPPGLYRESSAAVEVDQFKRSDCSSEIPAFTLATATSPTSTLHLVAALLKGSIRSLQGGLIPEAERKAFFNCTDVNEMKRMVDHMPLANQSLIKAIHRHIHWLFNAQKKEDSVTHQELNFGKKLDRVSFQPILQPILLGDVGLETLLEETEKKDPVLMYNKIFPAVKILLDNPHFFD